MKLTTILLVVSLSHLFAAGYAQRVSIDKKNASLKTVLLDIQKQTGYNFLYNTKMLRQANPVDVTLNNVVLEKALAEIFEEQPFTFVINRNTVVVKLKAPVVQPVQELIQVSGKVFDENNLGIPGVTVKLKDGVIGTMTATDGRYELKVPKNGTLVFSFLGYATQEIEIKDRMVINVVLDGDPKQLEQVVVIGYGTQIRKNITGSITKVDMKKTENLPNNNIGQALRGRVAGVQFLDGGRPGQNGSLLIRGPKSLSASNAPLIVMDGIFYAGSLSDISPNDIESMEILKDASAAAIYGSRAANGVILITSKRGRTEVPEIRFNGYAGISDWAFVPKLLSPDRYVQRIMDYRRQAGLPADPDKVTSYLSTSEVENYLADLPLDPWEEISQDGRLHSYDVSISGKGNKIDYFFSSSNTKEQGLIFNDNMKRNALRATVETNLKDWFKVGFNASYSNRDISGYNNTGSTQFAVVSSPYGTWYYEDGEPTQFPVVEENAASNPMRKALLLDNQYVLNNLFANFYTKIDVPFVKGLSYRLNYAPNYRWNYENNFFKQDKYLTQNTTYANKTNQKSLDNVLENIVTYTRQLNANNYFDLTLLYGTNKQHNEQTAAGSELLSSDVVGWDNLSLGSIFSATSSASEVRGTSSMFRLNYRLHDRYLFTVTARRDGSSVFAANNKYAVLPSGSFAWVISDEPFMAKHSFINSLKLRTSYGAVGNQAISPYQSLSLTGSTQYTFADRLTSLGLFTSRMANADLKWETTYTANVGLDFEMFKGRIGGAIEVYNMDTRNLLVNRAIPTLTGFNSVIANIGEVNNRGLEVTLNLVPVRKAKFEWAADLVFSYNKNKIVHLYKQDANGDGREDDDISNRWFIGKPMNVAYDYVFDGIYQEGDEMPAGYKAGFVRLKDISGDGIINAADRQILGQDGEPRFRYGITNNFRYGNFSLSTFINIAQGWQGQFNAISPTTSAAGRSLNQLDNGWWTAENKSNQMPSLVYNNPVGHGYYVSRDFIRLQDVALSYTLPQELLKKVKVNSARLSLSAKNLATVTDWVGPDPESGRTSTGDLYPRSRNFTIGFNVGF